MNSQLLQISLVVALIVGVVVYLMKYKPSILSNSGKVVQGQNTLEDIGVKTDASNLMPKMSALSPEDLLPTDTADKMFQDANPISTTELKNRNFLEMGRVVGILSPVLKNSNLDIRAPPLIERKQISIWNESTKDGMVIQGLGDRI